MFNRYRSFLVRLVMVLIHNFYQLLQMQMPLYRIYNGAEEP
jgi:hypothetical protein